MAIAFFDFDRTLVACNSGSLWVRAEVRNGHLGRLQALHAAAFLAAYHLGFVDVVKTLEKAVSVYAGTPEAEIRRRTESLYDAEVRQQYRPGGRAAVDEHRRAGDRVVLLTSSSKYMAELATRDLELDGYLSCRYEIGDDGRLTGRPARPVCAGPGKTEVARAYADPLGVELSDCTFYTDSASDLPMLEVVGQPVAVHPDPRLRAIARRRGWKIADWDRA